MHKIGKMTEKEKPTRMNTQYLAAMSGDFSYRIFFVQFQTLKYP